MRVGHTGTNQVQSQHASDAKRAGKSGTAHAGKAAEGESRVSLRSDDVKADISPQAKEFAHAKSVATEAPDVREERIAALKQKIAEGRYHVDANAIADRLVDEHLKTADMG